VVGGVWVVGKKNLNFWVSERRGLVELRFLGGERGGGPSSLGLGLV
jgi:hypothetical protein